MAQMYEAPRQDRFEAIEREDGTRELKVRLSVACPLHRYTAEEAVQLFREMQAAMLELTEDDEFVLMEAVPPC